MIIGQYIILKKLFADIPELAKFPLPFNTAEIAGNDYEEFATFEQWAGYQDKFQMVHEVTITRKLPPETLNIIKQHWVTYSNNIYDEIIPFPYEI